MSHEITYTTEGNGTVAACSCGWLRFASDETTAREYARKHLPKEK